jgi:hypothetical protein
LPTGMCLLCWLLIDRLLNPILAFLLYPNRAQSINHSFIHSLASLLHSCSCKTLSCGYLWLYHHA